MLPKKFRLTFSQFYKNPEKTIKVFSGFMDFHIKKSKTKNPGFVLIVPKFLDKRSVVRHKIKRMLAESIYSYLDKNKASFDVLIKVKKITKSPTVSFYQKEIAYLFSRLDLLGK